MRFPDMIPLRFPDPDPTPFRFPDPIPMGSPDPSPLLIGSITQGQRAHFFLLDLYPGATSTLQRTAAVFPIRLTVDS